MLNDDRKRTTYREFELIKTFLIRYFDSDGHHLRIRIKFKGDYLVEEQENIFYEDAIFGEKILSEFEPFEKENLDKWYMSSITYSFMQISNDIEDMPQTFFSLQFNGKYRKEYLENSKNYIELML